MKKSRLFLLSLVAVAIAAVVGWQVARPAEPPAANAQADSQSQKGGRKGGGVGGGAVPVVVASVDQQDFQVRRRAIGWVESPAVVTVRARIDGQILEQHVQDGQMVKQGDLLFVLDDREQKAQLAKDEATRAKDQALHARADRDLSRAKSLAPEGYTTKQQLDVATADERSATAAIASDQAAIDTSKLKLSYTKIYAPIDGRAGAVKVTPGNLVNASSTTSLVDITQMAPVRVSFALPERELPAIKAALAQPTAPQVRVFSSGSSTPLATGTLSFLDSVVDQASGTVIVKARFDNADLALWPGQYVDVELDISTLQNVAVVPTIAIQAGQSGPYVYAVKNDGTVERRAVTTAAGDADKTAVTAGLSPGERVVIEGQLSLVPGARVRAEDHLAASQ